MPESLVNTIKGLRLDKIPVGEQKFFDSAVKQLNEIGDTLTKITTETLSKEARKTLMEKYETKTDQELKTALEKKQADLKKEAYGKVHPKAFALLKGRLSKMKAYLSNLKKGEVPTLKGMFAHSEPELALITRLFERVEERPCSTLAMGKIKGVFRLRGLEEALKQMKKNISKDEKKQLKKAIASLRQTACKRTELCVTMDL